MLPPELYLDAQFLPFPFFSKELSGYYLLVGIVGLLILAFEIWLVVVDIKTIGALRKTICQLQKQLRQSHSTNKCADECPSTTVSNPSLLKRPDDQDKFHF